MSLTELSNSVIDEQKLEIEGSVYWIKASNPHGFYALSIEKGRLPDNLKGKYTSKRGAEMDLRGYLADKNKSQIPAIAR